jgi:hypothetical protein
MTPPKPPPGTRMAFGPFTISRRSTFVRSEAVLNASNPVTFTPSTKRIEVSKPRMV